MPSILRLGDTRQVQAITEEEEERRMEGTGIRTDATIAYDITVITPRRTIAITAHTAGGNVTAEMVRLFGLGPDPVEVALGNRGKGRKRGTRRRRRHRHHHRR
jgi:hypothetical protein